MSSGSSTFTHVTAMDDAALQTPRGFISQSQPSPGSSLTITPTSSRDLSGISSQPTPTSVPLPPSTPGEEEALRTPRRSTSPPSATLAPLTSELPQDFVTSSPASGHKGEFKPPQEASSVDDLFHPEIKRRTMLQSTGSSSSTSLEVSEILEGARKPGHEMEAYVSGDMEVEPEPTRGAEIEDEGETEIQEQIQEGSEILPSASRSLDELDLTAPEVAAESASGAWPKAPTVDEEAMHGMMEAKRLAWDAIERAQRAEALRLQQPENQDVTSQVDPASAPEQREEEIEIFEDINDEEKVMVEEEEEVDRESFCADTSGSAQPESTLLSVWWVLKYMSWACKRQQPRLST